MSSQRKNDSTRKSTKTSQNSRKKVVRIQKFILILIIVAAVFLGARYFTKQYIPKLRLDRLSETESPDWIDVQIIPLDGVSRDGVKLDGYNDIVVHYVGNPGTSAQNNHDFYCNADSEVSSHFIVGLEGEIIQCLPLNEKSAASNWRNHDTISIEVCHPDDTGEFNEATYNSLVRLVAWLADLGYLSEDHIIRHYDVTGKECPRYYVQHEDAWEQFKQDVKEYRKK